MEPDEVILTIRRKPTELSRSASADEMGTISKNDKQLSLLVPLPGLGNKVTSLNALNLAIPPSQPRLSSVTLYRQKLAETGKHLKKDLGSYQRETKHFSENTTMHGPKRVYKGKRWSFFFWTLMFISSIVALCAQVYFLVDAYLSKPTVSQVSFGLNEKGVDFPVVTICPFNPIMKSRLAKLNATGDFSEELLSYLLETNVEAPALYSSSNKTELRRGDKLYREYLAKYPEFNLYNFFDHYGFQCHDIMRWCTFGGRKFDCCEFATHILTPIGRCQRLDIRNSEQNVKWMKKQTAPGHNAGLQLILDSRQHEQFTLNDNIVASPLFEHGFRYYVHDNDTVPYLQSEGISISPGMRVYSALSMNKYILLDADNWGHCETQWPEGYIETKTNYSYTASSCTAICMAKYFVKHCNCSPSAYDINDAYPVCSPLQVVDCMDKYMKKGMDLDLPDCPLCKMECKSNVYQTFNSYGRDFSATAMKWLAKKNASWTPEVIKNNFLTINIFFRDLSHTEYKQVPATSLTELLSNIGGNMGMFLGMSTITITEISLFLCKIFWIFFSRSRRNYMAEKKKREEDQDKEVVETVKEFKRIRSCTDLHSINGTAYALDLHLLPTSASSPPMNGSVDSYGSDGILERIIADSKRAHETRDRETDSGNGTDR